MDHGAKRLEVGWGHPARVDRRQDGEDIQKQWRAEHARERIGRLLRRNVSQSHFWTDPRRRPTGESMRNRLVGKKAKEEGKKVGRRAGYSPGTTLVCRSPAPSFVTMISVAGAVGAILGFPSAVRVWHTCAVNFSNLPRICPLLAAVLLFAPADLSAAQLEVLEVRGVKLKSNPLGDPAARRVAVFVPDGTKNNTPLPLVIYLPGWGGSSEDMIAQGRGSWLGRVADHFASAGLALRIAVVDGVNCAAW